MTCGRFGGAFLNGGIRIAGFGSDVTKLFGFGVGYSAFKEIAGETAIYFNPQDEDDIYLKLKLVLENGEEYKAEKIEKAFKKSQQFSWEKAAAQTLNIYESSPSASSSGR